MKNISRPITVLAFLITAAFVSTCRLFDSNLANTAIDGLSFFAGTFLAIEGFYKIRKFKGSPLYLQAMRSLRMIIGFCIFSVHLVQLIWGIDAPAFNSPLTCTTIDWFAFLFGIFLMMEGTYRIFQAKGSSLLDQSLRAFRVMIGTCVFTIHILQFARG